MMSNPSAARRQEMALPMPLVAPTTTARFGVLMLMLSIGGDNTSFGFEVRKLHMLLPSSKLGVL